MSENNLKYKNAWLSLPFTQFPKIFDRIKEVSGTDKTILRVLFSRISVGGNGQCYPQQKTIADDAGVSIKTVQRSLIKWRKLGIIDWKRRDGRIFYYMYPIPMDIERRYGCIMKDRKKLAEGAISKAGEDVHRVMDEKMQKRLEKEKRKISDSIYKSKKKTKDKSYDVYHIVSYYGECFDKKFNYGKEKKTQISLGKKELGQIKKFVSDHGVPVFMSIIHDFFENWDIYKRKWNIDTDYPTIGIIIGFGKGRILSFKSELDKKLPVKDLEGDKEEIDPPEAGWR